MAFIFWICGVVGVMLVTHSGPYESIFPWWIWFLTGVSGWRLGKKIWETR